MSITDMIFIFVFLPIALLQYHIGNDKIKKYILLFFSLSFYALGCLDYLLLFTLVMIIDVVLGRTMARVENMGKKKLLLVLGILINAGLLVYYKYVDFALLTWGSISKTQVQVRNLALPLGISFFTFRAISYLVDVYKKKVELTESPITDALYLSFFPQLQSGPLTRYQDMLKPAVSRALFANGIYRFLIGFNKKILLANVLANITNEIYDMPIERLSTAMVWLGSICYSMQLFFDFAGYSDMAIGLSEMFGYSCKENFNFPYMTESVTKFWRRWHISLSEWFRDYVYIPLGGSRNKIKYRVYFNLLVVWILTGIWHGASWNFVVWGLGYFVLISFERLTKLPERLTTKLGKVLYRVFALAFINFEWVLFRAKNLSQGVQFLQRMIVPKANGIADIRTAFLLKDYRFFLCLAVLLCFPITKAVEKKVENNTVLHIVYDVVMALLVMAGFIWDLSFIVAGQNNPFAYANF